MNFLVCDLCLTSAKPHDFVYNSVWSKIRPRYASWSVFVHSIFDAPPLEPEKKPGTPSRHTKYGRLRALTVLRYAITSPRPFRYLRSFNVALCCSCGRASTPSLRPADMMAAYAPRDALAVTRRERMFESKSAEQMAARYARSRTAQRCP